MHVCICFRYGGAGCERRRLATHPLLGLVFADVLCRTMQHFGALLCAWSWGACSANFWRCCVGSAPAVSQQRQTLELCTPAVDTQWATKELDAPTVDQEGLPLELYKLAVFPKSTTLELYGRGFFGTDVASVVF